MYCVPALSACPTCRSFGLDSWKWNVSVSDGWINTQISRHYVNGEQMKHLDLNQFIKTEAAAGTTSINIMWARGSSKWRKQNALKPLGLGNVFSFLFSLWANPTRKKTWWFIWPISLFIWYVRERSHRPPTRRFPDKFVRSMGWSKRNEETNHFDGINSTNGNYLDHLSFIKDVPSQKGVSIFPTTSHKNGTHTKNTVCHSIQFDLKWRMSNE